MQKDNSPRWIVILNPHAGNGKAGKKWQAIRKKLDQHLDLQEVLVTAGPGDATRYARELAESGHRYIIGAGGDGTNFEIINGFFAQQSHHPSLITYALLPIGTGNDWIRHHQIPKELNAWIEMIRRGKTTRQDIGYLDCAGSERKYFLNVAGMAYDAFVVKFLEPWRKWMVHPLIYLFGILRCLFLFQLPKADISLDDTEHFSSYTYTINAGICKYSGGGMQVVPHAIANDGKLAITIAPALSKLEVLLNTPKFYRGTLDKHPKIITRQVRQILVKPANDEDIWVEADGELLGKAPVSIGILPGALKIVVP